MFEHHYNYFHYYLYVILFQYLLTLFDEFLVHLRDLHLNFILNFLLFLAINLLSELK